MPLGIVIANIASPLRQSPVETASANISVADITSAKTNTASPTIAASQPQLDPNLTIVVLQLLNEQGVVTATIPSAQQLAAYRAGTAIPPA